MLLSLSSCVLVFLLQEKMSQGNKVGDSRKGGEDTVSEKEDSSFLGLEALLMESGWESSLDFGPFFGSFREASCEEGKKVCLILRIMGFPMR